MSWKKPAETLRDVVVENPETLKPFAEIPPAKLDVAFASPLIVVVAVFPIESESSIETRVDDA